MYWYHLRLHHQRRLQRKLQRRPQRRLQRQRRLQLATSAQIRVMIYQNIYGEVNVEGVVIGLVDRIRIRRSAKDVRSLKFLVIMIIQEKGKGIFLDKREFTFIVQEHVVMLEKVHVNHKVQQ